MVTLNSALYLSIESTWSYDTKHKRSLGDVLTLC